MSASELGFGGLPILQPSQLCVRYSRASFDVVAEEDIRIGARYRARKDLVEHVSQDTIDHINVRVLLS